MIIKEKEILEVVIYIFICYIIRTKLSNKKKNYTSNKIHRDTLCYPGTWINNNFFVSRYIKKNTKVIVYCDILNI